VPSKYQDSKDRYLKEKVEEFKIRVPKGEKAIFQSIAKQQGKSLNAYVLDLLHAYQSAIPDEKTFPPASDSPETNEKVTPKQLTAALHSLGILEGVEDLSDEDLRFLSSIASAVDGWFSSK
jgi:hypothetical protein